MYLHTATLSAFGLLAPNPNLPTGPTVSEIYRGGQLFVLGPLDGGCLHRNVNDKLSVFSEGGGGFLNDKLNHKNCSSFVRNTVYVCVPPLPANSGGWGSPEFSGGV